MCIGCTECGGERILGYTQDLESEPNRLEVFYRCRDCGNTWVDVGMEMCNLLIRDAILLQS